jgi:hypothetical protein
VTQFVQPLVQCPGGEHDLHDSRLGEGPGTVGARPRRAEDRLLPGIGQGVLHRLGPQCPVVNTLEDARADHLRDDDSNDRLRTGHHRRRRRVKIGDTPPAPAAC